MDTRIIKFRNNFLFQVFCNKQKHAEKELSPLTKEMTCFNNFASALSDSETLLFRILQQNPKILPDPS